MRAIACPGVFGLTPGNLLTLVIRRRLKAYSSSLALWRFGDSLTLIGLPGEAVADYVPRIEETLGPASPPWLAAYCNESFGYLPTAEILRHGGHESMRLTLAVGLFSPQVEETAIATIRKLAGLRAAGRGEQ